jgi:hypothetical protein
MKLSVFLAVGALAPLWVGLGQDGVQRDTRTIKPSTRLQLQFEVDPAGAKPGGQVFARLRLKNTSAKVVQLEDSFPDFDFRVTVVDASGREPATTERGESLLHKPFAPLSTKELDLQPGEEQQITIEITRLYQLAQPGTYYARAVRNGVWPEAAEDNKRFREVAYSNPVEFKIVP